MTGEEFKNLARLRNGIETIVSNLRQNYHLIKLPRGKQIRILWLPDGIFQINKCNHYKLDIDKSTKSR